MRVCLCVKNGTCLAYMQAWKPLVHLHPKSIFLNKNLNPVTSKKKKKI